MNFPTITKIIKIARFTTTTLAPKGKFVKTKNVIKNDNNDIDYDKWCNLYKEETSELVKEIKSNDVKIKKLNKVIRKNKYKH